MIGSLFIFVSCVGGAWLIARLGIGPVQGITPSLAKQHASSLRGQARPFVSVYSASPGVLGVALSSAVLVTGAPGFMLRAANVSSHSTQSEWFGSSVTDTADQQGTLTYQTA